MSLVTTSTHQLHNDTGSYLVIGGAGFLGSHDIKSKILAIYLYAINIIWQDLKMDNTSTALDSCSLSTQSKLSNIASYVLGHQSGPLGVPSAMASAIGVITLVAPGPEVTRTTPGFPQEARA